MVSGDSGVAAQREVRREGKETSLFPRGHFLGFEVLEQVMRLKDNGGSLREGEGGRESLAMILVTRVDWPCHKGLGNAVLTPWQLLKSFFKAQVFPLRFSFPVLFHSQLTPTFPCCSFCCRGFAGLAKLVWHRVRCLGTGFTQGPSSVTDPANLSPIL